MAKVRLPLQGLEARGKFGDIVYGVWRSINVARVRAIPTQPRTPRQLKVRNIISSLSRSFGALTLEQIQEWNDYAASHPRTDELGTQFSASGANMYTALGFYLLDNSDSVNASPPAVVPAASVSTLSLSGGIATPANGETLDLTYFGSTSVDDYLQISIAGPFQTKARKAQSSDFTHFLYADGNSAQEELDVGNVGSWFWAKSRVIDEFGQITIPQSIQFISLAGA